MPPTTTKKPTTRTSTTKASTSKATTSKATTAKTTASKATGSSRGKRLVIVESPAKAKTIEKYLGAGYTVRASMGHIRDLPKSTYGVDPDNDFAAKYLIPRDKLATVKELKKHVEDAKEVILATDPDREGEAIAWHLVAATEPQGKPVRRVVFHEITPDAVREAMEHPRDIDMDLVDAQQARRILDRIVGYGVSPLLWKKVKRGLSAGRVQSAALRIVAEREREIIAFNPVEYWSLDALLAKRTGKALTKADQFKAALSRVADKKAELSTGEQTHSIIADLEGASYRVKSVTKRETQRRPSAPFTTSTLQQEASRKLSYQVRRTMSIAQELYEGINLGGETVGLITYMRTDSTNVSAVAQQAARTVISVKYGPQYVPSKPPVYAKKSKGAQEAHEAIRPTAPQRDPESVKAYLSPQQYKLYQMIWQRFLASQMAPAILDGTTVDIAAGPAATLGDKTPPYTFRATGSVMKFPGFTAVYTHGRDEGDKDELDEGALPLLAEGEDLDLRELLPDQHFTQPPPRFTEATLVKALEEQGIGRPSTYAPTIATIVARSYVTIDQRKLIPTELGFVVNDILVEHFPSVVDLGFTSKLEDELDEIATGDRAWVPTMREFYGPFSATLKQAETSIERVKLKDEPAGEDCDKCGRPMVIKIGRFGKFKACSGFPDCRNAQPLFERIGMTCPECNQGDIAERRSKKGRVFYGCTRYPDCSFVSWNKPIPTPCPKCGSPYMVEAGRKGQVKCPVCNQQGSAVTATAAD